MLGTGQFGVIYKGTWDSGGQLASIPVAIKARFSDLPAADFLHEAQMMMRWETSCVNVLRLFGVCTAEEPHLIVLEYVALGSLDRVLQTMPTLAGRILDRYAVHIARGMAFLHQHKVAHCDLATRNVLVSDQHECKIADFGLALSESFF
jgi:serine/threonine protein kinase